MINPRRARVRLMWRLRSASRYTAAVALAVACGLGATGCAAIDEATRSQPKLRMIIPNSPGGGYDLTGRAAVKVIEDKQIAASVEITNIIGAGGSVAMQRLVNERGAGDVIMMMGLGVVGATYTHDSDARISKVTPIASIVQEQEGILVPADSPLRTVHDLVAAWELDPKGVRIGGGSFPGGPDHLFLMQLAQTVGVDPKLVDYVTYDGGGPLTTALLSDKLDVATSGLSEFSGQIADGTLRVLAVSGEERINRINAPTLKEANIDMVFTNWRGILAPPGITRGQAERLIEVVARMRETAEWKDVLRRNGWVDSFSTGAEFGAFLDQQDEQVAATLADLGLT